MITLVLVFATGAMEFVPQPTLGAIVIVAALSLADVAGTRRLWRQRRMEFTLSVIALLGVALLGPSWQVERTNLWSPSLRRNGPDPPSGPF